MKQILSEIKFAKDKGFFHIFSSQVLNRMVRFASLVVVVRLLSKEIFGSFSYAQNILQIFLLFNGLGVVSAVMQFCSEKKETHEKLPYLKYGIKIGGYFNIFLVLSIILYVTFFDLPIKGSVDILLLLSLMPFFILIFEIMTSYLRADLKNKEFAYLNVTCTVLYFVGTLAGGLLFKVHGIIAGRYIAFFLIALFGFTYFKKEVGLFRNIEEPDRREKKEFLKYSITVTLINSISQFLLLVDVFLIGLIIKDEMIVASYKTATVIPFTLAFIPMSVMTFIYPYFARNLNNKAKLRTIFYKLQKYLIYLNIFISIFLIVFAPLIIKILFGQEYLDAVLPFRILSIGYFISGSFRVIAGNVIASVRKIKINLFNAIISGTLNIVLDIILIQRFGSVGAAIATTSVFVVSSIISNVYLFYYFKD